MRTCTQVFDRLRPRRCILEADDARLWMLRSACARRPGALRQRGGRGGAGSPCRPRHRGRGRGFAPAGEERLRVGPDFVLVLVLLVVHAGPGRLVLHALQTLVQGFEGQLSGGAERTKERLPSGVRLKPLLSFVPLIFNAVIGYATHGSNTSS